MDTIWPYTKPYQNMLVYFMEQLELLYVQDTVTDTHTSLQPDQSVTMVTLPTSKVIIPGLVKAEMTDQIISSHPLQLESIFLKFSLPHVPYGLLSKLCIRCIKEYPNNYTLYINGYCFNINDDIILIMKQFDNLLRISLQPSASYQSLLHRDLLNSANTADVAMATLMFLQASLSDIITKWFDTSVKYELCMRCCHDYSCHDYSAHYVPLGNINDILKLPANNELKCDDCHVITTLPDTIRPWFGEEVPVIQSGIIIMID